MENWSQWLPLLAPMVLIQLVLMIVALTDLIRRDRIKGRSGYGRSLSYSSTSSVRLCIL